MALLDWDNRYFSVQNWRIKKERSTYCPECFPSLFSSSCLSRVCSVHAKSQWRVQSRASSHAWIHIHCHYRYLTPATIKKVNKKTLTTLNYIFNGVWEMDLMPGYPLSTLIIVFRFFQSNCSLQKLHLKTLGKTRQNLCTYQCNSRGWGGECGQGVGIWQILKFFDQIPQGGKRKVNQKCQKSPHPREKI